MTVIWRDSGHVITSSSSF